MNLKEQEEEIIGSALLTFWKTTTILFIIFIFRIRTVRLLDFESVLFMNEKYSDLLALVWLASSLLLERHRRRLQVFCLLFWTCLDIFWHSFHLFFSLEPSLVVEMRFETLDLPLNLLRLSARLLSF